MSQVKRGRALPVNLLSARPVMLVTPAKASRRHSAGNISTCASLLCFTMTQPATAMETGWLPQQSQTATYFYDPPPHISVIQLLSCELIGEP